ncbi:peptidoglycan-associated lipoprotein Pal [bacterium]|nr:peptidoglycan-associated lipoprotein Pal [bacterium]
MRSKFGFAIIATAVVTAACASNPPETPVATAPATEPRVAPTPPPTPTPPPAVQGPAPGSRADFQAKVTDRVYFDYDQYNLDDADRRALQAQAQWMNAYPTSRVQIEGNCDERGTKEYNVALGLRRAASVKDYLVSLGVASSRIETISWGKDRPIAEGSNEDAWSRNRNAYTNVVQPAAS